jgi:hypothetical protein
VAHLLGSGLDVRPQVEESPRRGALEQQGGEARGEDGALPVCALPPRVRELQMDSRQTVRREEAGNDRPGVGLDHPEVPEPTRSRPVLELARVLLAPFDRHVENLWMARGVAQGEGAPAPEPISTQGLGPPNTPAQSGGQVRNLPAGSGRGWTSVIGMGWRDWAATTRARAT